MAVIVVAFFCASLLLFGGILFWLWGRKLPPVTAVALPVDVLLDADQYTVFPPSSLFTNVAPVATDAFLPVAGLGVKFARADKIFARVAFAIRMFATNPGSNDERLFASIFINDVLLPGSELLCYSRNSLTVAETSAASLGLPVILHPDAVVSVRLRRGPGSIATSVRVDSLTLQICPE